MEPLRAREACHSTSYNDDFFRSAHPSILDAGRSCHFCRCNTKRYKNLSTGGGTRTHTSLRTLDFESSASANSATPARVLPKRTTIPLEACLDQRTLLGRMQNSTSKKIGCTARGRECELTGNGDRPKLEILSHEARVITSAANPRVL